MASKKRIYFPNYVREVTEGAKTRSNIGTEVDACSLHLLTYIRLYQEGTWYIVLQRTSKTLNALSYSVPDWLQVEQNEIQKFLNNCYLLTLTANLPELIKNGIAKVDDLQVTEVERLTIKST